MTVETISCSVCLTGCYILFFFLPLSQSCSVIQMNPTQISHSPSPSCISMSPSLPLSSFLLSSALLARACRPFPNTAWPKRGIKRQRGRKKRQDRDCSSESKDVWDGKASGLLVHKPSCESCSLFYVSCLALFFSSSPSYHSRTSHCLSSPVSRSVCTVTLSASIAVSSLPFLFAYTSLPPIPYHKAGC